MGFADSLQKMVDKEKGNVETAVKQTMFLAAQGLVLNSPVDSGRFKGNWQFGHGSVNTSTSSPPDKDGNATLGRIKAEIDAAPLGGVFYISNSLPYAKRLENGWSKQQPYGMVRLTIQALPSAISRYVKGQL